MAETYYVCGGVANYRKSPLEEVNTLDSLITPESVFTVMLGVWQLRRSQLFDPFPMFACWNKKFFFDGFKEPWARCSIGDYIDWQTAVPPTYEPVEGKDFSDMKT